MIRLAIEAMVPALCGAALSVFLARALAYAVGRWWSGWEMP